MLLRLTYLGMTNAFALLRLLTTSDHDKEAEILVLRHQITVLHRQLGHHRVRFSPADRAFLAVLLHHLPRPTLPRLRLLVRRTRSCVGTAMYSPAATPPGPEPSTQADHPPCAQSEHWSSGWHRKIRTGGVGEYTANCWYWGSPSPPRPSGKSSPRPNIHPAPERAATTWADFLRSQVDALLAGDFFETHTLSGTRMYVFAVIEHAHRRIRILGATAHPTTSWVTQAARNLVMDLADYGGRARLMIRDRDGKVSGGFDAVLADAGIRVVLSGVQMPRMSAIMERSIHTCRRELLDRTLLWNQRHLPHALREFERFYNCHRPRQGIANARPLHPLPPPITDPVHIAQLDVRRHDHLGDTLHEYQHAA
ncbi:MAG TPA: integrase [Pseudonocardia sp.]|nr:integrase [Pseudonocardia sp.]